MNAEMAMPLYQGIFAGREQTWLEAGQGRVIVLLHGISSGAASWHKQLEDHRLTQVCRVMAWDAPGYGCSADLVNTQPSADDYAQRLAAWLTGIEVEQILLVGHSLGALIASAYAARYPERIASLVLVDPAQGYGTADEAQRNQVFEQRRHAINVLGAGEYARQRAGHLLKEGAAEVDIERIRVGMRRIRPGGFLAAAWMLANDDIGRYLSAYCGRLQIWCGDQDKVTPPAGAERLAECYAAPFSLLPKAGHASYLDAPAVFNRYLLQLMDEWDTPATGVLE
ncbi:alpha/beta fold hydrolase [Yersinia similis]|uniref:Esterase ybfF n=1 Tax=Yersinia similis TaxID=367190 RepID=A0A0T9R006_9GAMM|nr:alpha/beta hydrolase [Yersinia similis]AHK18513.1 hydrolase [Yersinia similis]CFQ69649.1 esterase ybfF [Yersinia similis]CNC13089.1 esterase ybfF [Yersinia similis]CNF22678.1 esterase ybfF [Yersinia similis]CNG21647.1 esterase ybfF [Yersinia similis]